MGLCDRMDMTGEVRKVQVELLVLQVSLRWGNQSRVMF